MALKQFSLVDVAKHDKKDSKYIVIDDKVYDVTKFVDEVRARGSLWMGGKVLVLG
jgi:cytochrome b involved in lipid metabolism